MGLNGSNAAHHLVRGEFPITRTSLVDTFPTGPLKLRVPRRPNSSKTAYTLCYQERWCAIQYIDNNAKHGVTQWGFNNAHKIFEPHAFEGFFSEPYTASF
jgi:hypothetical protein